MQPLADIQAYEYYIYNDPTEYICNIVGTSRSITTSTAYLTTIEYHQQSGSIDIMLVHRIEN